MASDRPPGRTRSQRRDLLVLFAVMAVAQSVMLGAWASKLPEAEVESSQSALGEAKDNARITADSGLATLPASMLTDKVGPPPSPKGPDRRGYGGSAAAPQSAPPLQVGLNPNHFYTAKHEEVVRETTKRRQANTVFACGGCIWSIANGVLSMTGAAGCGNGCTSIVLRGLGITSIDASAFASTGLQASVERIELVDNQITSLSSGTFNGLAELAQLYMDKNSVSSLPGDLFNTNAKLAIFYIDKNKLTTLPAELFRQNPLLIYVHFAQNGMTSIPSGLFDANPALQAITFWDNKLTSVPANLLDNNPALKWAYFNQNQITSFPVDFFKFNRELTHVWLQDNALETLQVGMFDAFGTVSFDHPDGQSGIYLNNNKLREIPMGLFQVDPALKIPIIKLAEGNLLSCLPSFPPNVTLVSKESQYLESCKCKQGSYMESFARTSCTDCTAGSCADGQELCPEGSTVLNFCRACPPGSYATAAQTCRLCEIGTYQDASGQTSCKNCPSETYMAGTAVQGSTSASDCQCKAGASSVGGTSSLLAGGAAASSAFDGVGAQAQFSEISDLAVSSDGSFAVVADQKSHVIRKVDMTTGATSLIAGSGAAGYAGDDNDKKGGSSAEFSKPSGVVLTPDDKYAIVVDSANSAIRAIDLESRRVYLLAGGELDAVVLDHRRVWNGVRFALPSAIALKSDSSNSNVYNIYVADGGVNVVGQDWNATIRRLSIDKSQIPKHRGSTEAEALPVGCRISGLALRQNGQAALFSCFVTNLIYSIDLTNNAAPVGVSGGATGYSEGIGTSSSYRGPGDIAISPDDRWALVADSFNNVIRKVDLNSNYQTTTFAGPGNTLDPRGTNGIGTGMKIARPQALAFTPGGAAVLIADASTTVRIISFLGTGQYDAATRVVKTCKICPGGSIAKVAGSTECSQCEGSSYSPPGADTCTPCPRDAVCPNGIECSLRNPGITCTGVSDWNTRGAEWEKDPVSNVFRVSKCKSGHVLVRGDSPVLDGCEPCPDGTFSQDNASFADKRMFSTSAAVLVRGFELCAPCPAGANCAEGKQVAPKPGFWRGKDMACSKDSCNLETGKCDPTKCKAVDGIGSGRRQGGDDRVMTMVYRCPPSNCVGSNASSVNQCREGHYGPVCGLCTSGWAMESGLCVPCKGSRNEAALAILILAITIAVIIFLYFFSWRPLFGETAPHEKLFELLDKATAISDGIDDFKTVRDMVRVMKEYMPKSLMGYIKVLIGFWQVTGSFNNVFTVEWPKSLVEMWSVAGTFFSIDVLDFPGIACLAATSFRTKLIYSTLLIPIAAAVLAVPPLILFVRRNTSDRFYREAVELFWFSLIFVMFTVYPSVSRVTLSSFSCFNLGTDGNFMRSDFREVCPSTSSFEFIWSIIFTIFIPVGCPIFMAVVLIWSGIPALARKKRIQALLNAVFEEYSVHVEAILETLSNAVYTRPNVDRAATKMSDEEYIKLLLTAAGHSEAWTVENLDKVIWLLKCVDASKGFSLANVDETFLKKAIDQHLEAHKYGQYLREATRVGKGSTLQYPNKRAAELLLCFLVREKFQRDKESEPERDLGDGVNAGNVKDEEMKHVSEEFDRMSKDMRVAHGEDFAVHALVQEAEKVNWLRTQEAPWKSVIGSEDEEEKAIRNFGFIFTAYRPSCWWFELFEMTRKFMMASVMIFVWPGSAAQIGAGFLITLGSLLMALAVRPFQDKELGFMHSFSLIVQAITLYAGIMLITQRFQEVVGSEGDQERKALGVIIILLQTFVFLSPLVRFLATNSKKILANLSTCGVKTQSNLPKVYVPATPSALEENGKPSAKPPAPMPTQNSGKTDSVATPDSAPVAGPYVNPLPKISNVNVSDHGLPAFNSQKRLDQKNSVVSSASTAWLDSQKRSDKKNSVVSSSASIHIENSTGDLGPEFVDPNLIPSPLTASNSANSGLQALASPHDDPVRIPQLQWQPEDNGQQASAPSHIEAPLVAAHQYAPSQGHGAPNEYVPVVPGGHWDDQIAYYPPGRVPARGLETPEAPAAKKTTTL